MYWWWLRFWADFWMSTKLPHILLQDQLLLLNHVVKVGTVEWRQQPPPSLMIPHVSEAKEQKSGVKFTKLLNLCVSSLSFQGIWSVNVSRRGSHLSFILLGGQFSELHGAFLLRSTWPWRVFLKLHSSGARWSCTEKFLHLNSSKDD